MIRTSLTVTDCIRSLHFMMLQQELGKNPGRYRPSVIFVYDQEEAAEGLRRAGCRDCSKFNGRISEITERTIRLSRNHQSSDGAS